MQLENSEATRLDNANLFKDENQLRRATALVLLTLIAIGFWLRVRHLGDLALIVDEGIQALAIKGVLNYGVPKVDSGYVYTRALSFLYTQAAFVKLFELNPFWLRLPSVLFGVATIIPSYILGKILFGRSVGLLAASILALSVWEIELSRYARFYTIFQFMYLISIICFYKGFMRDERNYKIWFLLTAFITFSTHSLSQILLCLFFIPLLSPSFTKSRKVIFGLWGLGLFVLLSLYKKFSGLLNKFRDPLLESAGDGINAVPSILDKILGKISIPPFHRPDLSFFSRCIQDYPLVFAMLFMIVGISTIFFIYRLFRRDSLWEVMFATLIVWAAFFYQFAIAMILLTLCMILFVRDYRKLWEPHFIAIYAVTIIFSIAWFIIINNNPEVSLRQTTLAMFGFPKFARHFLYWLIRGWPLMTAVFALGCLWLLNSFFSSPKRIIPIFVLGAIFIPALMASFFRSYNEARYIFHLYPLIVVVFSMVAIRALSYILTLLPSNRKTAQILVSAILISATFFISQDANPLHAWSVGNRNYQSTRDPVRSVITWKPYAGFHQDHRSPSDYVKNHLSEGDKIVVIGLIHMIGLYHYYTGKVDYAIAPNESGTYYNLWKEGRPVNYVTGSENLGELPGFKAFIEDGSQGVWLLGDYILLRDDNPFYSASLKEYLRPLIRNPDYIGLDGQTFAVKLK
jgi:hypothetical protein